MEEEVRLTSRGTTGVAPSKDHGTSWVHYPGGRGPYLLGGGRHALLNHDEGPCDVLLLHALTVYLDCLDPHFGLLWGQMCADTLPSTMAHTSPGVLGRDLAWLQTSHCLLWGLSFPTCKGRPKWQDPKTGVAASAPAGCRKEPNPNWIWRTPSWSLGPGIPNDSKVESHLSYGLFSLGTQEMAAG